VASSMRYWVGLAERLAIHLALEEHHGDRRKAAKDLGIGLRTLYFKLRTYRETGMGTAPLPEEAGHGVS
jgi:transcriptional regulator with PAS, ATPase and Fis domain